MTVFIRDDGAVLQVEEGFRDRVLAHRESTTVRPGWSDEQYVRAARKKRQRARRLIQRLEHWYGPLDGATMLDAGCGDGLNCLALALEPIKEITGVDLDPPLQAPVEHWGRGRELAWRVLELESERELEPAVARVPVRFERMDAAAMRFEDDCFDVVLSRSAMEHFSPIDGALREMTRVLRPGGLLYLGIDPFYWLRGCHKRGVVDIPWAHARLSLDEFRRFVSSQEGDAVADKRCRRLETLNRLTVHEWRRLIEATSCEILDWQVACSSLAEEVLREHPDVNATLLPTVQREDLIHSRIHVWLRKPPRRPRPLPG